ncbi:MAG: hypothetical protein HQL10_10680 [Nitrospirae bacterium]|nr:hypothetical protein [Nitrospirota bacterium]
MIKNITISGFKKQQGRNRICDSDLVFVQITSCLLVLLLLASALQVSGLQASALRPVLELVQAPELVQVPEPVQASVPQQAYSRL